MLPELKKNADGSITIYVQKDSPGKDKESNWLPAPDGPMFIVDAAVLAEDRGAVGLPARRRRVEAAGAGAGAQPQRAGRASASATSRWRTSSAPTRATATTACSRARAAGATGTTSNTRGRSRTRTCGPTCSRPTSSARLALPAGATLTAELHLPAHALLPVRAVQGGARHLRLDRRGPGGRADRARPGLDQSVPRRRQPAGRKAQLHAADRRRGRAGRQGQARGQHAVRRQRRRQPDVRQPRLPGRPGQRRRRLGPGGLARRGRGLPTYTGTLADGTKLDGGARWSSSSAGRCRRPSRRSAPSSGSSSCTPRATTPRSNPATAPARQVPKWEKYWNIQYSILGAFKTPEERAKIPLRERDRRRRRPRDRVHARRSCRASSARCT